MAQDSTELQTLVIEVENGGTIGPFFIPKSVASLFLKLTEKCKEFWELKKTALPDKFNNIVDRSNDLTKYIETYYKKSLPVIDKYLPQEAVLYLKNKIETITSENKLINQLSNENHPAEIYLYTSKGPYGPIECTVKTALVLKQISEVAIKLVEQIKLLESNTILPREPLNFLEKENKFRELVKVYADNHKFLLKPQDSFRVIIFINDTLIKINEYRGLDKNITEQLKEVSRNLEQQLQ